jgi:hypothetical protein
VAFYRKVQRSSLSELIPNLRASVADDHGGKSVKNQLFVFVMADSKRIHEACVMAVAPYQSSKGKTVASTTKSLVLMVANVLCGGVHQALKTLFVRYSLRGQTSSMFG